MAIFTAEFTAEKRLTTASSCAPSGCACEVGSVLRLLGLSVRLCKSVKFSVWALRGWIWRKGGSAPRDDHLTLRPGGPRACLIQPLEGAGPWERDLNWMHDLLRSQPTQSLDIEGFSFEGPALFLYYSDVISDCPP